MEIMNIILIAITAIVIAISFYFAFLQPYRNRFMIWYMKNFSRDYRSCLELFNYLIDTQDELVKQSGSTSDGYYAFLELMHLDSRFRTAEYIEQLLFADRGMDSDTLINKDTIPLREWEQFVYFCGKNTAFHKIVVHFDLSENIHLRQIWFFYHEECHPRYLFELEKKCFPLDGGGNGGRRKTSPIQPEHPEKVLA